LCGNCVKFLSEQFWKKLIWLVIGWNICGSIESFSNNKRALCPKKYVYHFVSQWIDNFCLLILLILLGSLKVMHEKKEMWNNRNVPPNKSNTHIKLSCSVTLKIIIVQFLIWIQKLIALLYCLWKLKKYWLMILQFFFSFSLFLLSMENL
jgi:hypothetical protein